MSFVVAVRNGILYVITSTKNGVVSILTFLKNTIFFGFLAFKNGLIGGIQQLKNCLIMALRRAKDAFYHAISSAKNYIHYVFITIQESISNLHFAIAKWIETKIVRPIRNAFRTVIQFLRYWVCAHWWPNFKSWLALHILCRLQLLFNYFCFGIVYVSCGYWVNPFIAFLSKYFRRFYAYFQQYVLNPIEM